MTKNYGLRSYNYLQKWQNLTKDTLALRWPFGGKFQLDNIVYLKSALESKCFQAKLTE